MIERLGHTVVDKVATGQDAIKAARIYKPDLILMDIRLQGEMDGIQAMKKIRKEENIPVIFITGNSDEIYKERIEKTEHLDFLTKPVTYSDLNKSVNFTSSVDKNY